MADAASAKIERRPALAGLTLFAKPGAVTITDAGPRSRYSYRGPSSLVTEAFGVASGETPCLAATAEHRASLWLGPDERLLIAPDSDARAIADAFRTRAASVPHSLVDVSHRNAALLVTGPRAAQLLNAACPLDLDASAFPVDMCTRTVFGKAEIVLWRIAPDAFHVEVWRSFIPYATSLMTEAARDV